jgi:toxin YoeB
MKHKLCWHLHAWQDYLYWLQHDKKMLQKINELIKAVDREPYGGVGKPEPLKHNLQGAWSRRINREHRLVYVVQNGDLNILACCYHYI